MAKCIILNRRLGIGLALAGCFTAVVFSLFQGTSYIRILGECQELYLRSLKSGNDSFFFRDGLPKHIAALKPQVVQVRISETRVIVEIKLRTGFWPKGLLCVLDDGGVPFEPNAFHYRLTQVYSNIYEYSEGR
jgi:hypothetical protein